MQVLLKLSGWIGVPNQKLTRVSTWLVLLVTLVATSNASSISPLTTTCSRLFSYHDSDVMAFHANGDGVFSHRRGVGERGQPDSPAFQTATAYGFLLRTQLGLSELIKQFALPQDLIRDPNKKYLGLSYKEELAAAIAVSAESYSPSKI